MAISLKNKKVLITAGPTWVKLDDVRIISNSASAETGILLAEKLSRAGIKVTLILGPVQQDYKNKKIRILRFSYFDELRSILNSELKTGGYGIAVHSAAVSDYRPTAVKKGKVDSNLDSIRIRLVPTPKLIDSFKKASKDIYLVGFKFEPDALKSALVRDARKLIERSKADAVLANTLKSGKYISYLVSGRLIKGPFNSKAKTADVLTALIKNELFA